MGVEQQHTEACAALAHEVLFPAALTADDSMGEDVQHNYCTKAFAALKEDELANAAWA